MVERATRRILAIAFAEGKRHDFQLFKDSRLRFGHETEVVKDSGYQGAEKIHQDTVLPLKKPKGGKLTREQKRFNRTVAQERITNEHVIGTLKRFRIIADKYRNRRKRFGLRINLIAALCNMNLELAKSIG